MFKNILYRRIKIKIAIIGSLSILVKKDIKLVFLKKTSNLKTILISNTLIFGERHKFLLDNFENTFIKVSNKKLKNTTFLKIINNLSL